MAGSLRGHLDAIYEQRRELTPAVVVDAASKPKHPLHHRFEWDDTVAGHKYRLVQAADLIRSVKMVYVSDKSGDRSVRAFTAIRPEEQPERMVYRPTDELLKDDFSRRLILRDCQRELLTIERKYGHLEEFAEMVAGVLGDKAG